MNVLQVKPLIVIKFGFYFSSNVQQELRFDVSTILGVF